MWILLSAVKWFDEKRELIFGRLLSLSRVKCNVTLSKIGMVGFFAIKMRQFKVWRSISYAVYIAA